MARRKPPKRPTRGTPFTPFAMPSRPPAGLYDPALDSQESAATRGLEDLRADTGIAGTRSQDDFFLAQNRLNTQAGDSLADILTARRRGEEDYTHAGQTLDRRYGILGQNQLQAGNQAGLLQGGFAQQAARKRAENKGLERADLDRGMARFREDSTTSEGRVNRARDTGLADIALGYQRGVEDRTTGLSRAEREDTFFGNDINAQRFYQASGAGWVPPEKPRNEGTRNGVTYRKFSNGTAKLADGRVVTLAELRKLIARGAA